MRSIHDQNEVFGKLNIRPNVLECLMNEIKRRLQVPPVRIKADFELTCFKQEGINAIKKAFRAGESVNTMNAKFKIITSPIYICEIITDKKEEGLKCINNILSKIENQIKSSKGEFTMKNPPEVLGEKDELENARKYTHVSSDDENVDDESSQEEGINFEMNENNDTNQNYNPDDDDF